MNDSVTKYLFRGWGATMLMAVLTEIEFADNDKVQKFFVVYNVPFLMAAIAGYNTFAIGPMGWFGVGLIAVFLILGLL